MGRATGAGMLNDIVADDQLRESYSDIKNVADNLPAILEALATSTGNPSFLQSGTGAVARTVRSRLQDTANVRDFGALGLGAASVVEDTLAFQRAAASGRRKIDVPEGDYRLNATIPIVTYGQAWRGEAFEAAIVKQTTANLPLFTIAAGLNGVQIEGMGLGRTVPATSGGNAIECSTNLIGQARLANLLIQDQWRGLSLGPTDFSEIEKVIVQSCYNSGVFVTNTVTVGAVAGAAFCQWSMDSVLSQKNNGRGYLIAATAGAGVTQMNCGTMKNCSGFGNGAIGVEIIGTPGLAIQGFRMIGGFFGEDASHAIYLNTYGDQHTITGTFVELAGQGSYGRGNANAPSNSGSGIYLGANNGSVQMNAVTSVNNSHDGLTAMCNNFRFNGGTAIGNSRGAAGYHGIVAGANVMDFMVTNSKLGGSAFGGLAQGYGVVTSGASDRYIIADNLVSGNTGGGVFDSATGVNKRVGNNY